MQPRAVGKPVVVLEEPDEPRPSRPAGCAEDGAPGSGKQRIIVAWWLRGGERLAHQLRAVQERPEHMDLGEQRVRVGAGVRDEDLGPAVRPALVKMRAGHPRPVARRAPGRQRLPRPAPADAQQAPRVAGAGRQLVAGRIPHRPVAIDDAESELAGRDRFDAPNCAPASRGRVRRTARGRSLPAGMSEWAPGRRVRPIFAAIRARVVRDRACAGSSPPVGAPDASGGAKRL